MLDVKNLNCTLYITVYIIYFSNLLVLIGMYITERSQPVSKWFPKCCDENS